MNFFFDINKLNDFTYNLKIKGKNYMPIYKTIKKFLKSVHYDNETASIDFTAENVETLKTHIFNQPKKRLKMNECIKMIDELTKQMFYLKSINYGFYGFDINDILVIDGIFIFVSSNYLLPIIEERFIIYSQINSPYFSNPELLKLTTLPSKLNPKCCYYSLGVLVVFCLLNSYLLVGNDIKSDEEIENILLPMNNTKIYWFIKRCLEASLEKRYLLLI